MTIDSRQALCRKAAACGSVNTTLGNERNFDIADEVAQAAEQLDTTPAAVAIAWTARRPAISSVIIGPRTPEQLQDNLAGIALELPAAINNRLDTISTPTTRPITGTPDP